MQLLSLFHRKFIASFASMIPLLISSYADAQSGIFTHVHRASPSFTESKNKKEKMVVKYMCVAKSDGKSYPCSIKSELGGIMGSEGFERFKIENLISGIPSFDCPNTNGINVEDLYVYGGHTENKSGRFRTLNNTSYKLDAPPDGDTGQFIVEGEMKTNVASELIYETPERAGIYSALTTLIAPEPPPGADFIFVFRDGRTINFHLDRHIISIDDLGRLVGCPDEQPIVGENYILNRTSLDIVEHPESHWGRPETLDFARELANRVFEVYGFTMSYNDLSLLLGGFHEDHKSHRTGRDIDINADSMGYDCNGDSSDPRDYYIDATFAEMVGPAGIDSNSRRAPYLDCYDPPKKGFASMHIDVTDGR